MAIQANELRIGNLVRHVDGGEFKVVGLDALKGVAIMRPSEGIATTHENISGIPLSSSILERCGFKDRSGKVKNGMSYGIDINTILELAWYEVKGKPGEGIRLQTIRSGFTFDTKVVHLHSLQNLYWCLCGKDLEIR